MEYSGVAKQGARVRSMRSIASSLGLGRLTPTCLRSRLATNEELLVGWRYS